MTRLTNVLATIAPRLCVLRGTELTSTSGCPSLHWGPDRWRAVLLFVSPSVALLLRPPGADEVKSCAEFSLGWVSNLGPISHCVAFAKMAVPAIVVIDTTDIRADWRTCAVVLTYSHVGECPSPTSLADSEANLLLHPPEIYVSIGLASCTDERSACWVRLAVHIRGWQIWRLLAEGRFVETCR